MALGNTLKLVVVTPEKTLVDQVVAALRFPLFDGEIGVHPGRAPLIGRLGTGTLHITEENGQTVEYFIDGGFAQVVNNVVTLLTGRCIAVKQLTIAEGEALLQEARTRVAKSEDELTAKQIDQDRGRKMIATARA